MLKRIKRITSHSGHARFLAQCEEIGHIKRIEGIPSPYHYAPVWTVYAYGERRVIIRETAHRQFDVFELPMPYPIGHSIKE